MRVVKKYFFNCLLGSIVVYFAAKFFSYTIGYTDLIFPKFYFNKINWVRFSINHCIGGLVWVLFFAKLAKSK